MKIKLDENMPIELCGDLRALGHDADTVQDEGLSGAPDRLILGHVRAEGRMLWRLDKGIADIRQYPPSLYAGIVLYRIGAEGPGVVYAFIRQHIDQILAMDVSGRLLVITEHSFRIR